MTHSISTESPADTIDALADLASAANELTDQAKTAGMRGTERELTRIYRQLMTCAHRLEADTISVDACMAYLDTAADKLATFAARIGEAAHARG